MSKKLYNPEVKKRFLEKYPYSSYERILQRSYVFEEALGKDLYDFNMDDIKRVLYDLNPLTLGSSRSNGRIITSYIDWAIEEGFRRNNINPLKTVQSEWFDQFVDQNKKIFITDQELEDIERNCVNAQDAVIVRALFEGLTVTELLNLKKEDVDYENNVLKLKDDKKGERTLKVSDQCIKLISQAATETKHYKNNGMVTESTKRTWNELIDNEYVLRPSKTKVKYVGRADEYLIYRRLYTLKKTLGYPYLTTKNISNSGKLKMARDLYLKEGALGREQLEKIAERFNISIVNVNGYETYNLTTLRDFITPENLKAYYDITI